CPQFLLSRGDARAIEKRGLRGALPAAAESARRHLDACRGTLPRRARQRPGAEKIRLPGDRQSGGVGVRRVDCGRARLLPAVTVEAEPQERRRAANETLKANTTEQGHGQYG